MKIKINIQSLSSIITNSSSETFCVISSDKEAVMQVVTEYLNSFLPYKVMYSEPEDFGSLKDRYYIMFDVEYGETSYILGKQMHALIKQLLSEHFPGDNSFIIEDGTDYN